MTHDLVTHHLGRLAVSPRRQILANLPEDPRVRGRRTANHHRIATRLAYHADRVFRSLDIAIADDWQVRRGLQLGNPRPVRDAGIALLASPRMHCDRR